MQAKAKSTAEETDREEDATKTFIEKVFGDHPLFKDCSVPFAEQIARGAPRYHLKPGEELPLEDSAPLFIVLEGCLRVVVGQGPMVLQGPGTIMNIVGLMQFFDEVECFRPRGRLASKDSQDAEVQEQAYSLTIQANAAPPVLFTDRRKPPETVGKKNANVLSDDSQCFYNLCPLAAQIGSTSAKKVTGWINMKIEGGPIGAAPLEDRLCHGPVTKEQGGAVLAVVDRALMESAKDRMLQAERHSPKYRPPFSRFMDNLMPIKSNWKTLLRRCMEIFPGLHPQVMWNIAEITEIRQFKEGEELVVESDAGESAENVIVIDEGEAMVEKLIGVSPTVSEAAEIGHLGPGAIIGDVCLIGATLPRAATARAMTNTRALVIPAHGLLEVMRRYPGMLSCMGMRLKAIAGFLQTKLPMCSEVLAAVNFFSTCDETFLRAISGDRRAFYGGHIFDDEDDGNGMIYALEYGTCVAEVPGQGVVSEITAGMCFGLGDPFLQGKVEFSTQGAIVRVVSPIIVVVSIGKRNLLNILDRFHGERQRFDRMAADPNASIKGRFGEKVEVFRDCGVRFVESILDNVEMKCYMPGQTMVVMGSQDASQMFILKSGYVGLEKVSGERFAELQTGATFGELVMLGVMRRRTVTVRALTFCFTMEIPRATFLSALEEHPEERQRFESLAMKHLDLRIAVIWPILKESPPRMHLLLNLHAERRMCPAKDPSLREQKIKESAILLLQGTAVVMDPSGKEVQNLNAGDCFNEQILLAIDTASGEYIVPKTPCEVQIVSKQAWDKVIVDFPQQQESVARSILRHMVLNAEFRYGVEPGSNTMLQTSALFRATSSEFVDSIRQRLKDKVFREGTIICEEGRDGSAMHIMLSGSAECTCGEDVFQLKAGSIIGEAELLGIEKLQAHTVRCTSLCVAQKLRRCDFLDILANFPADRRVFEAVVQEAESTGYMVLSARVRQSLFSTGCSAEFLDLICAHTKDVFYTPHEVIIAREDDFVIGRSSVFLLLAGQGVAHDDLGVSLGVITPGEVIGEFGLAGFSVKRTAHVRAAGECLVHCASIPSGPLHEAINKFPNEYQVIKRLCEIRASKNQEFAKARRLWLEEIALPALKSTRLLSWAPSELLQRLAAPLNEEIFDPDENIVLAGEPADSLVFLVQGTAEMVKADGTCVGRFTDGASFGEIAILGIFATRPSTVRALTTCRVLKLSRATLSRALDDGKMDRARKRFESITEARREQTLKGFPICALPMAVDEEDVCARAVALQAEEIDLEPGETLDMLSDRSPSGPHFSVLAHGRVTVEMKLTSDSVMTLMQGSLLLEGMLADYGARIRAKIACEVYRVRNSDFMIAVSSVPSASDWFYRFRLLEKETRDRFLLRLKSARGAIESCKNRPRTAPAQMLCKGGPEVTEVQPPNETLPPARPSTASAVGTPSSVASRGSPLARSAPFQASDVRPSTAGNSQKLQPLNIQSNKFSHTAPGKTEAYAWASPQRARIKSAPSQGTEAYAWASPQRGRIKSADRPYRGMQRKPSNELPHRKLIRVSSAPVRNPRQKPPCEQVALQDPSSPASLSLPLKSLRQRCASAVQRSRDPAAVDTWECPPSRSSSSKSLRQRCNSSQRPHDPFSTF